MNAASPAAAGVGRPFGAAHLTASGVKRATVEGSRLPGLVLSLPLAYYNGLLDRPQYRVTIAAVVGVTLASMVASHLRIRRERELANVRLVAEIACAEAPEEGVPLGLSDMATSLPKPYSIPFGSGDQILLYTDGVIETRDGGGAFYPLTERIHLLSGPDPQAALDELRADLLRHRGGPLPDDAAMPLRRRQS
ncbi:SpoIIE family protein phosphatase [Thermoactinospora rubra]|uniref:PP2C family protein-serine/threonine phosphatase n=1 Tax=Thermoactinospora rubra TaxID=1088767 RepID=UPI00117CBB14